MSPRVLVGRQTAGEMSASQIAKLRKAMERSGFDEAHPVQAAEVEGKLIILDGHHRARAAASAKLREVPVVIQNDLDESVQELLMAEVEHAAAEEPLF